MVLRRVEDGMRPLVRTAMKGAVSESRAKSKQSRQEATPSEVKSDKIQSDDGNFVTEGDSPESKTTQKGERKGKEVDFKRATTSAPKRLNDIVQAPPEIIVPSRIKKATKEDKSVVFSAAHKRMMELERDKAIKRYRQLKEAKLKEKVTAS